MDIILEITDTFLLDYLYSWALPARSTVSNFPDYLLSNTTQAFSTWQYKPATSLLILEPTKAAYSSIWARDNIYRQALSLFFITWLFGALTYFIFATLSYFFVFNKRTLEHPKFIKNQVFLEIKQANIAMPVMSLFTTPLFVAEVRGCSKLYDTSADGLGIWYDILQFPFFLMFTDFCIYWIHRYLHHPLIYKRFHKPHHKWIVPTPFASYAFHPLDGFSQSLPYHIFPFIFPLQKMVFVFLFIFVNFWAIMIHDGEYMADNPIINGAACHSVHHYAFNYNYGQYTTLWDRMGGSYRAPDRDLFNKEIKMSKSQWEKQATEMEKIVKLVEGRDDRTYELETKKSQ